jgi:hypothetical protein
MFGLSGFKMRDCSAGDINTSISSIGTAPRERDDRVNYSGISSPVSVAYASRYFLDVI